MTEITLEILWGFTAAAWVVGSVYNWLKSAPVQQRGFPVSWVLGLALYGVVHYLVSPASLTAVTLSAPWSEPVGWALMLVFMPFTLYSRVTLGLMWTSEPAARTEHQLRTDGPYAVTRHPIYTGLLGMMLGTAFASHWNVWVIYWPGAVLIALLKIRIEERILRGRFGEQYDAYAARVPQLVPGLRF